HFDGTSWTNAAMPPATYVAIWGSATNDVWAVGQGGAVAHYDGATWTKKPSSTAQDLAAVWGAVANNVWAVGDGVIIHWNGSAWSPTPGGDTAYLYAVWGTNTSTVWAAGAYGAIGKWNGTAWSGFYGSITGDAGWQSTNDSYVGIWGSSAKDVWAI